MRNGIIIKDKTGNGEIEFLKDRSKGSDILIRMITDNPNGTMTITEAIIDGSVFPFEAIRLLIGKPDISPKPLR